MAESSLLPAGSLRLLLAEDEPHIRRVLITLLEAAGFQVDAVPDLQPQETSESSG